MSPSGNYWVLWGSGCGSKAKKEPLHRLRQNCCSSVWPTCRCKSFSRCLFVWPRGRPPPESRTLLKTPGLHIMCPVRDRREVCPNRKRSSVSDMGLWRKILSTYLLRRHFSLETDGKPLVPLLSSKHLDNLPPYVLRFCLRLARYNFSIAHVPGTLLYMVDTLSHAPIHREDRTAGDLEEEVETSQLLLQLCLLLNWDCRCTRMLERKIWVVHE